MVKNMANGNYTTVSRTKILEYLSMNCDRAVNVQDIYGYLLEKEINVNITTIYRYMDKLTKDGNVMKYSSKEGQQAVYQYVKPDANCSEHLHLQCVKCGSICHLDKKTTDKLKNLVNSNHLFSIECKNSIIYGKCKICQDND